MKRIGVLLVIIGALFLVVGAFYVFKPVQDEADTEVLYDGTKTVPPAMQKEHCIDDLCIKVTEFTYGDGIGGCMNGRIINRSGKSVPAGYLNVTFVSDNDNITKFFYHSEVELEDILELCFSEPQIAKAKDYILTYPTEEELALYQSKTYLEN